MQWYALNMSSRLLILNGIKLYVVEGSTNLVEQSSLHDVHVRVRELLWHIEGVSLLLHIFFYQLYK